MKKFVVAVDGPAGSGKSTISKIVADKHDLNYLDTGAMYRMIALKCIEENIDLDSTESVEKLMREVKLDIDHNEFFLDGRNVSSEIRTPEVTKSVSKVASIREVRVKLVDLQRKISEGKRVILDGRDIGSVVFPNADLKIFLNASSEERAKRRVLDYKSKGIEESFEDVLKDIIRRDNIDSTREESPLVKAEDAIEIDTSSLTIEDVCNEISRLIEEK